MKPKTPMKILASVLATLLVSAAAFAGDSGYSLSTGVDYSSGSYGLAQDTRILFVPVTGKYQGSNWSIQLSLPFVSINGPASSTHGTSEQGLGDVSLGGSYDVYASTGPDPLLIAVGGKIKFGTAAASKDLGTGVNDYSLSVDLFKTFGLFTAIGGFGHKFVGDAPGVPQNNVFFGSVGGAYKFSAQTSGGLIVDLREKIAPTGAGQTGLTEFVSYKINSDWKTTGYLVQGFTRASPDWGLGFNIKRSF
jgi:hypothetical protein